ncbi:MAG: SMI1/KNR4 family protein [Phycisphaerae bacterium]|nr:SMI1/KNR4 family protein [Phycisphaerae bacterium]
MKSIANEVEALLSEVPRPPEDSIPSGATDEMKNAFEKETRLKLPPAVRQWLGVTNGPCVGPGGIMGIQTSRKTLDMQWLLELHPNWIARKWIPIAGDGCGNYYIVSTAKEFGFGEPVLFVEASVDDNTPVYIVASDIWHFLRFLFMKELGKTRWPFDKATVQREDPQMLAFRGVALPWEA